MQLATGPREAPRRALRSISLLGGLALAALLPGCTLYYRHRLQYEDFSLYGNQSRPTLERTGGTIQQVFSAYRDLFPSIEDRVDGARVCYQEDALSQERIFTGELRQEGFYLPWLDLIHLSPRRPRGDADDLSVILHEMAHHFLISGYRSTSSRYWLNEGLACSLEVSYFDEEGRLLTPYFHLGLYGQARRLLREQGEEVFRSEIEGLLGASWLRFHHSDEKNRHYAYSWGLFWQLLRTRSGTLDERVREIVELPDSEVRAAIDGLVSALGEGADSHLAAIAGADPSLRGWCLDRWIELPWADGRRFLPHLLAEIDPDGSPSPASWARAAKLANGQVRGIGRAERGSLHERIAARLGASDGGAGDGIATDGIATDGITTDGITTDGIAAERLAIAEALAEEGSRSWVYIEPLIAGLEDADGELRALCAKALARSRRKPTVVNPEFWREAPAEARAAEVDEWRRWARRAPE